MSLKVLIIGGGGREHAISWKISQSPKIRKIYAAPGNGGTFELAENITVEPDNIDELALFAQKNNVDVTIVGPEGPLARGIVNKFRKRDLRIFGPVRSSANLEASKADAKWFMLKHDIPTAQFHTSLRYDEALGYVKKHALPVVIKASGLAQGKGVRICNTFSEAEDAIRDIMVNRRYGGAGDEVVIEKFLEGDEISAHAFCDGKNYALLPISQDHKKLLDRDKGPNTGGMGAYAPIPFVKDNLIGKIREKILDPTIIGLIKEGSPFTGLLYPGLKITKSGPMVLEYNVRFGDPEAQVYMRLLKTDLLEIVDACIDGRLNDVEIEWGHGFAVCVVLASSGYPDDYKKGEAIKGLKEVEEIPGVAVFHAGTVLEKGSFYTSGGRVLGVTAIADSLRKALEKAYDAVHLIHFHGMHYRKDIGAKTFGL